MKLKALLAAVLAAVLVASSAAPQPHPGALTTLTLFAGTADGLWRSQDWGRSWDRVRGRVAAGVRLDEIGAARSIRPLGARVWLSADAGLYVSDDFGETWTALATTTGARVLLLPRYPEADLTVFVGTESGLLRSRDGGRTFSPTGLVGAAVHRLEWPGPALVAAGDRGVLVTRDEGVHFAGPGAGLPEGPVRAIAVSSFFAVDPVLFAAPASGGVYRSPDGGDTWTAAGLGGERVRELAWLGPFLYAAAESAFFRSTDAGRTWDRLSASPGRPACLLFPLGAGGGPEAFLATDRGLFHTPDAGGHWDLAGFPGQDVLEVATFPPPDASIGSKRR
ncbi:MAG TPA: hypothetical protein VEQ10_00530 [Vicinamibacteria bacterium]|nr:hypothetical protein [Vicinamibacteria bacterium]